MCFIIIKPTVEDFWQTVLLVTFKPSYLSPSYLSLVTTIWPSKCTCRVKFTNTKSHAQICSDIKLLSKHWGKTEIFKKITRVSVHIFSSQWKMTEKKINERYSYDDPYNFVAKLEKKRVNGSLILIVLLVKILLLNFYKRSNAWFT